MMASWKMLSEFCPAHFGVLFSSVVLDCRYCTRLYHVVSCAHFRTGGVFEWGIAHSQSVAVLSMLYKIRCNPMHPLL